MMIVILGIDVLVRKEKKKMYMYTKIDKPKAVR